MRRCNFEFDVLRSRVVLQRGGTDQYAATDDNARNTGRDNEGFAYGFTSALALTP